MIKSWGMLLVLASLFSDWGSMCEGRESKATMPEVETGYANSFDGTRLYYLKMGSGSETVLIPGRLFLFPDFQRLAKGRTLIAYDMRNRGQSDAVTNTANIGLQQDADDLDELNAVDTSRDHLPVCLGPSLPCTHRAGPVGIFLIRLPCLTTLPVFVSTPVCTE